MHRYWPSLRTDGAARAEPNGLPLELCRVATEEGKAKYGGAQVATEDMLTPDMLQWSLGATIGIKFSKKFAIDKQAQKVSGKNLTVIDDEGETEQTNTAGQGGNTPGGELEG